MIQTIPSWITPSSRFFRQHQSFRRIRYLKARASQRFSSHILMSVTPSVEECIQLIRAVVPPLDGSLYKGQAGKIAVIGGSKEYTGAPYFAAISAMRGGADLSFVYCAEEAAQTIKSYSPDLIVYPGFEHLGEHCENLNRMNAIVFGPGLGRSSPSEMVKLLLTLVNISARQKKVLVIDADGLWFLANYSEVRNAIRSSDAHVIITPNKVELDRILASENLTTPEAIVSWFQGHVVLVQKGPTDIICGGSGQIRVTDPGSLKRVGGQGDILAGLTALCSAWIITADMPSLTGNINQLLTAAAVTACCLTRSACRQAFQDHGRAMLASDILSYVGSAVSGLLDNTTMTNPHRIQETKEE